MVGLPNNGDELDPPPQKVPQVSNNVQVQSGISYHCWIHMRVGAPKGKSQAIMAWVEFSNEGDKVKKDRQPSSASFLTAQGHTRPEGDPDLG